jgi:pimeloyl-ACP methyl ester carboxylesterase
MTIAVSRPGYRRTPLSSGATFEAQADLFAALLDELGIDRAFVLAASGGGYAGLQFALRHPDRTMGLILSGPEIESQVIPGAEPGAVPRPSKLQAFVTEFSMWLLGDTVLASSMMTDFDPDDSVQLAMWSYILKTSIPFGGRDAGRLNDLSQRMDPAIDDWPLEEISVPTLFLHGDADEDSSYDVSRKAAARIPNSEFATFEGGDHFVGITRWSEFSEHIRRFTTEVSARAGSQ